MCFFFWVCVLCDSSLDAFALVKKMRRQTWCIRVRRVGAIPSSAEHATKKRVSVPQEKHTAVQRFEVIIIIITALLLFCL